MSERACRRVLVSGRVQGVAFRFSTVREAQRLGLTGWVRNLSDGRVEAWIEGPAECIDAMLAWLGRGPSAARVDDILVYTEQPTSASAFTLLPTAHC